MEQLNTPSVDAYNLDILGCHIKTDIMMKDYSASSFSIKI